MPDCSRRRFLQYGLGAGAAMASCFQIFSIFRGAYSRTTHWTESLSCSEARPGPLRFVQFVVTMLLHVMSRCLCRRAVSKICASY